MKEINRERLYPDGIFEVHAGRNELVNMIVGSKKTALVDCGRAFCGEELVGKIKEILGDRKLDYVFATHTHYDHIGALPWLRKEWPDLIVFGSEYGQYILTRPGALKVIKEMGQIAEKNFGTGDVDKITTDGISIDRVLKEGDRVSLGDNEIMAMETKGHTDCCLSFVLEPERVMFSSESTGVFEGNGNVDTSILKSFDDTMISLKKCRDYNPSWVIAPHFGIVPKEELAERWDTFEKIAIKEREFVIKRAKEGKSEDEILNELKEEFWTDFRATYQPVDAFLLNARSTIKLYMKEVVND
ncbi:MAG: MBL fold metallo-hydrolase [Anaerovoracaceae bacterium]